MQTTVLRWAVCGSTWCAGDHYLALVKCGKVSTKWRLYWYEVQMMVIFYAEMLLCILKIVPASLTSEGFGCLQVPNTVRASKERLWTSILWIWNTESLLECACCNEKWPPSHSLKKWKASSVVKWLLLQKVGSFRLTKTINYLTVSCPVYKCWNV